jgi:hexulose-6-phosphate isomerase
MTLSSRRGFLRSTLLGPAAAAVAPALLHDGPGPAVARAQNANAAAANLPKKRALKKAVMYATIGVKGSVMDKFQVLKAAAFEGVEPMSHMNQDEIVKALEATGLKAASVCCNTHWKLQLSHPGEKVREEGLDGLFQSLRDAKRYGADSVLLVPGVVNKDVSYKDCWTRSIAMIRKAIPLAETLGVKIAVENVWNGFIEKPEQAVEYLDELKSDHVGWHLDVGNTGRFNAAESWIAPLGKRILKLHIKEFDTRKMTPDNPGRGFGSKLLEGNNNWTAIMKALDDVGYAGWGISEQPGNQCADAATARDLSERMDRIFAM